MLMKRMIVDRDEECAVLLMEKLTTVHPEVRYRVRQIGRSVSFCVMERFHPIPELRRERVLSH